MKVEVSNGELLDKITILELKLLKIEDKKKLVNIITEFDTLNPLVQELFEKFGGQLQNMSKKMQISKALTSGAVRNICQTTIYK